MINKTDREKLIGLLKEVWLPIFIGIFLLGLAIGYSIHVFIFWVIVALLNAWWVTFAFNAWLWWALLFILRIITWK